MCEAQRLLDRQERAYLMNGMFRLCRRCELYHVDPSVRGTIKGIWDQVHVGSYLNDMREQRYGW